MEDLLKGLRAGAESTRLRLLFILSHGEFNVTELTSILAQSQPRVSRHLKLMCEAGLVDRHKEGSWVLFRLSESGAGAAVARLIVDLLPAKDELLQRDAERLASIVEARQRAAQAYFSWVARHWDKIRSLHVAEAEVEAALAALIGTDKVDLLLDLGTGTGRMLELFAPLARQAVGIDQSREMLGVARANIEARGLRHVQVRQGDLYSLPYPTGFADLVTIHQVLHYLDDPQRALIEAARVLRPDGRLAVVDLAPHELEFLRESAAHRRLGISTEHLAQWLKRGGLEIVEHRLLPPPVDPATPGLSVSLWLARVPADARRRSKQPAAMELANE
jgi:ubiquinone/menaquinone biosynthesis C-methylase UbiE/DNA-binding transcriptional ArsR family regulator